MDVKVPATTDISNSPHRVCAARRFIPAKHLAPAHLARDENYHVCWLTAPHAGEVHGCHCGALFAAGADQPQPAPEPQPPLPPQPNPPWPSPPAPPGYRGVHRGPSLTQRLLAAFVERDEA